MLRVTPLYGSRYDNKVASQESSCTLIEFGGVRILWNVGYRTDLSLVDSIHSTSNQHTNNINSISNPLGMELPEHDVLLISDSTLASCGGLPLYYRQQKNQQLQQSQQQNQQQQSFSPVKAYATFPTVKMGQMTMYDLHARISLDGGQPPFTLEELDASFALLQTIKYAQIINIYASNVPSSNVNTTTITSTTTTTTASSTTPLLRITAHRSGHVIGGSFFCLQRVVDDTVVVLTTPRYHMAKEMHLDSSTLLKYASTPDVLVCYPGGPAFSLLQHVYNHQQEKKGTGGRSSSSNNTSSGASSAGSGSHKNLLKTTKKQTTSTTSSTALTTNTNNNNTPSTTTSAAMPLVTQAQRSLTELVLAVVRRDGNVLLPVDASGRVWELLLLLHTHWERHRLSGAYHLIWIGPMVWNTWELGSSQLEWMATTLGSQFDSQRGHPLILQHVHKFISVTEMEQWLQKQPQSNNPMCVIASGADLEGGPARDLLLQWADNPDHAVIFTDSSQCVLRPAAVVAATTAGARREGGGVGSVPSSVPASTILSSLPSATDIGDNVMDMTDAMKAAVTTLPPPAVISAAASTTSSAAGGEEEEGADGGTLVGSAVTRVSPYCTAAQLLVKWCEAQVEGREMDDCVEVDVNVPRRAPLAGPELKAFLEKEEALRLEKKRLEEQRAMLREVELAKGQLRLGEAAAAAAATTTSTTAATTSTATTTMSTTGAGESVTTTTTTTSNTGADGTETLQSSTGVSKTTSGGGPRPKKKTKFDSTLFLKFSKPLHLTFEVREEAVGIGQPDSVAKYGIGESIGRSGEILEDDYGIAVIPERFVDIVTGIDPGKLTSRIGDERNRGFGLAASVTPEANTKSKHSSDDGRRNSMGDDVILMDEQALEAADLSEGFGIIRGRNGRPPTKVMTVPRKLEVFCEIAYVPLEGRVDARAARQSVRALQPRQVVILGGPKQQLEDASARGYLDLKNTDLVAIDEVTSLGDAVRSFGPSHNNQEERVFIPSDVETVELSVGHAAYFVRLINTPFRRLDEVDESGEPPEPVEPFEAQLGECTVSLLDCVATGQRVALDGSIVLAPHAQAATSWKESQRPCLYLSDGDVLLTNLRAELIAQGMKADYSAHTGYAQLIVNGKVVVKKDQESGKIHLEGPLTEDFFTVRSIVCGQYVTLQ